MLLHPFKRTFLAFALLAACDGVLPWCRSDELYWGKPVNLLRRDEAIALCETLQLKQGPDELCEATAAQRTHDPDQCEVIKAECIQHGPVKESCYTEGFSMALETCEDDVYVGFFKKCFEEQIKAANRLSCDDPPGRQLVPPPCLLELMDKCEGMFEE